MRHEIGGVIEANKAEKWCTSTVVRLLQLGLVEFLVDGGNLEVSRSGGPQARAGGVADGLGLLSQRRRIRNNDVPDAGTPRIRAE